MQIIAKSENGYLISATLKEVQEILRSTNGCLPEKLEIGQKIPAIDYATTITKIKELKDDYDFRNIFEKLDSFTKQAIELKEAVDKASEIEL